MWVLVKSDGNFEIVVRGISGSVVQKQWAWANQSISPLSFFPILYDTSLLN